MVNKPKLDLLLDKPIKLSLLKDKPYVGNNNYGEFYLYSVKDNDGIEYSYFATSDVHELIQLHKLKTGSSFILKKVASMNGKKMVPKIEFSIIGEPEPMPQAATSQGSDNLKELLLQCVRDAADVVKEAGIQFSNDEIQKLATTLFIQRSRNA